MSLETWRLQADLAAARAEIARLTKEMAHIIAERDSFQAMFRSCIKGNDALREKAQKANTERDEARAQVAASWIAGHAVGAGNGGCGLPCGYDCNGACFAPPAAAKAALEAYGRERVLAKVGEVETTAGPWALDTSTGSEILVKGGCSVIEGEDARYLLRLIAADTSTPAPDAAQFLSTEDGEFNGNVTDEPAAQVTATDLERIAADFEKDSNLDRYICCNGRDCGCQGATAGAYAAYKIRALAGDGK